MADWAVLGPFLIPVHLVLRYSEALDGGLWILWTSGFYMRTSWGGHGTDTAGVIVPTNRFNMCTGSVKMM